MTTNFNLRNTHFYQQLTEEKALDIVYGKTENHIEYFDFAAWQYLYDNDLAGSDLFLELQIKSYLREGLIQA